MRTAAAWACFAGAVFCAVVVGAYGFPLWVLLPGVLLLLTGIVLDPEDLTGEED